MTPRIEGDDIEATAMSMAIQSIYNEENAYAVGSNMKKMYDLPNVSSPKLWIAAESLMMSSAPAPIPMMANVGD